MAERELTALLCVAHIWSRRWKNLAKSWFILGNDAVKIARELKNVCEEKDTELARLRRIEAQYNRVVDLMQDDRRAFSLVHNVERGVQPCGCGECVGINTYRKHILAEAEKGEE